MAPAPRAAVESPATKTDDRSGCSKRVCGGGLVERSGAGARVFVVVADRVFDWMADLDCGGAFVVQPAAKTKARALKNWPMEVRPTRLKFIRCSCNSELLLKTRNYDEKYRPK